MISSSLVAKHRLDANGSQICIPSLLFKPRDLGLVLLSACSCDASTWMSNRDLKLTISHMSPQSHALPSLSHFVKCIICLSQNLSIRDYVHLCITESNNQAAVFFAFPYEDQRQAGQGCAVTGCSSANNVWLLAHSPVLMVARWQPPPASQLPASGKESARVEALGAFNMEIAKTPKNSSRFLLISHCPELGYKLHFRCKRLGVDFSSAHCYPAQTKL